MTLTYGALCAGYGGLEMGVQSVLGGETRWVSEFDPHPSRILAHHMPDVPNLGDMTRIDWATVEPVGILTGGTPCQDLSHAGKRAGMTDGTRSNLWVQMREAIHVIRPKLVVWENVRGAYSACADSDMGRCPRCVGDDPRGRHAPYLRALGRVLGDLSDLGYDAWWYGLRAADVGAAHGRFRVFVFATPAANPGEFGRQWGPRVIGEGWDAPVGREARSNPRDRGSARPGPRGGGTGPDSSADADLAGLQGHADPAGTAQAGRHGHPLAGAGRPGLVQGGEQFLRDGLRAVLPFVDLDEGADVGKGLGTDRDGFHGSTVPPIFSAVLASSGSRLGNDLTLLPTPAVNDMGAGKTPDDWDAWTDRMKAEHGNGNGHGRSASISRDLLLPTPRTSDTNGPGSHGDGGDDLRTVAAWAQYEAAIRRAEHALGRTAPAPTEPGPKGGARLSPRFVEWLMMLPDGHVTDPAIWVCLTDKRGRVLTGDQLKSAARNAQLKALGNGVVPAQAAAACRAWLHDSQEVAA